MSRNELCACGSGKRFKHCHGRTQSAAPPGALHVEALAAHRAGELRRAEALYRRALDQNPADVDSRHMLGVALFERMRHREALDHLWEAAERTAWSDATFRHNLGLDLAKLMSLQANARQEAVVAAYLARERLRKASPPIFATVSVVLPVYNAARSVRHAIASVVAQTYADIELVVVDDGSTDDTAAAASDAISGLAFAAQVVRRDHRGAARAANTGAELARGRHLAFLGANDRFAPQRIARMVEEIARETPLWGFSRAIAASGEDGIDHGTAPDDSAPRHALLGDEPSSFTLLHRDIALAAGNLFIERDLFRAVGGFRDGVPFRGWDFCVRASQAVEPVALDETLYFLRMSETLRGVGASVASERMARDLVLSALTSDGAITNELCPQFTGNRELLLRAELRAGRGELIPVPVLKSLAAAWRTQPAQPEAANRKSVSVSPAGKIALVVLGPYRSGTSALARALNLCGAALPDQLMPARLGINPTGFWESEAINDFDARLLRHLGGDWNRVDFALPDRGSVVDEFLQDAREVLAEAYGDAAFILIKDPRICVLAPLWQRALVNSGYRPAYVVPVRNPLEVARSLQARGDMAVPDGLALWLAYMQRIEWFVDAAGIDVVHVRYAELLDDWRQVVSRIAKRLDVPLAIGDRAAEVDRFIAADMRNQQAIDDELDTYLAAHVAAPLAEAVRTLYRRALARCEKDAMAA
ncbi:MAG: glycosyltransferase [Betaproteobacteria bacterium]